MQEEQKATQYKVHEMALQFPAQTPEERELLKRNMVQRVHLGLPPLESPILLVGGKIADGRHRYEIWLELAAEGDCDGYFAKNPPPVEEVATIEQDGEVAALLRINSRNLCHRTLDAGRKAAIFLEQVERFPSLKQKIEKIRLENEERMKAGKPLDNGSQGATTNEVIAKMAGVSPSTMKSAKTLLEKAPDKLDKVAKGEMSIKKALKSTTEANGLDEPESKGADKPTSEKPRAKRPKSPPYRKPAWNIGEGAHSDETRTVILKLNDSSKVAHLTEFFQDFSIKAQSERKGEITVFRFNGTSQDEDNLLTTLGDLLVSRGPMNLEISLNPQ